ncbi:HCN2, partial [Symbiodinium microadriaticum]
LVFMPTGFFRTTWDFIHILILTVELILLPLHVFDAMVPTPIFWYLDIIVHFRTCFYMEGKFVKDAGKIAQRYIRGWFLCDFSPLRFSHILEWNVLADLYLDSRAPYAVAVLSEVDFTSDLYNVVIIKFLLRLARFAKLNGIAQPLRRGALTSADGRQIAFDPVYGEQADEMDRIPNLSKTVVGIYTYLIAFTTGDSNRIVRNAGSDAGLEAWRRLHNEHDWLAKKRQYEEFTDQRGRPCRISDDSLMAAMYKLMPTSLEQQVMFHSDEYDSFEDLYDRLVAYASTKHSLKMTDKPRCSVLLAVVTGTTVGSATAAKAKAKEQEQEQEGWDQEGRDGWCSSSWSEQPAPEPPAEADQQAGGIGSLDLNHLESLAESVAKMNCSSVESYKVQWRGAKWLKLNYDSGAATMAIPDELIEGPLEARGEFIVASGEEIPNFGRFRVPAMDANGKRRSFAAYATKVHKPLGSAAEFSSTHDCVLWAEGGTLIPKNSALAIGLRKEYYRLKEIHGECDELPLYREGNLYNMYLKQDGVPEQLSPLQEASTSSGASAEEGRQSGNARQAKAIFEDGSVETVEDDWKEGLGWPTEEEEPAEGGRTAGSEPPHEESEEFRKSRAAAEPTPEQRENHFLENHAVYRPWCEVCVKSRGVGTQHRRALKKEAAESSEGPRIFSDYFFMSNDEDSVPMLALKFSRSKRIAAAALPRKGISELGCKFMSNFINMTGVMRFVNFSDGEPAMKALKEESARKVVEVEAIPRECPVGDHQKNGEIESAVREFKRQMRAVRMSLEGRLARALPDDDPFLMWIPTFAGDCIAFHRRGADVKTPWERETGRKWRRPFLEFGEKVMIKEAYDRSSGPKRDWQARMIPGRYVGHHARTGAVMGLTSEGVKFGTGVSRLAASERWSTERLEELRGLPWDLQPRLREARAVVDAEGVSVPRFPLMERDESVRVKDYRNRVQEAAAKQPQVPQQQAAATAEQQQLESSTQEVESRKRESVSGEVPESPSKRPVPASQWEQEGHGRYRKRQAEVPAEASAQAPAESGPVSVEVLGSAIELGEQKNELAYRCYELLWGYRAEQGQIQACIWYKVGVVSDEGWVSQYEFSEKNMDYRRGDVLRVSEMQPPRLFASIEARTTLERVFGLIVAFLAVLVFSTLLGAITNLTNQLNKASEDRRHQFRQLRKYLNQHHINEDLSLRITGFLQGAYSLRQARLADSQVALLELLSTPLRGELHSAMYKRCLEEMTFVKDELLRC